MKKDREKEQRLNEEDIKVIRLKTMDLKDDYESMIGYLEDIFKDQARELGIDLGK
ncbi:hypothetical protein [Rhodohalobacter sulfatireducens]|uniref:Uncharacterized protein n=1 Tax=Rhodohalobacter sulfatireducens TaxID=2911366 RepID=A0ABS9KBK2_9BACT|nr:hypothetical protein [Rhodohalobacter sulfatireducens]MCG2588236.1 hypothetical protein [Rhodohalobacter sulfatireducens]